MSESYVQHLKKQIKILELARKKIIAAQKKAWSEEGLYQCPPEMHVCRMKGKNKCQRCWILWSNHMATKELENG
jgi:hypothetical protein